MSYKNNEKYINLDKGCAYLIQDEEIKLLNSENTNLFTEENCTLSLTFNNLNKSVLEKVINEIEKENKRLEKQYEIKNREYFKIKNKINNKPYYRKEKW